MRGEFGYETTTLDSEGNVTRTEKFDHITVDDLEGVLPFFVGEISQVPPLFSAIQKNGKRLYESGREGVKAEDIEIDPRQVKIHSLELLDRDQIELPRFRLAVDCGGGTYIRSLVRDIGYKLNTVANTVGLERTKQGPFRLEDCLSRDDWSVESLHRDTQSHAQKAAKRHCHATPNRRTITHNQRSDRHRRSPIALSKTRK